MCLPGRRIGPSLGGLLSGPLGGEACECVSSVDKLAKAV